VPTFKVVADLGLLNSYAGLTVPLIASATATFLFRQVFLTIPDELMEAARIDGAGPMKFFRDMLIPLSRTNIAALFVILFIYGWNQYLWPLLVTTDARFYTVVAGIKRMAHDALGHREWFSWQDQHENVQYAAMPIGDAISMVLVNKAFEVAAEVAEITRFNPGMDIEEIAEVLEAGGFEFQTTSHLREVNGALMRLKGAKRNKTTGKYEAPDAGEIFAAVNESADEETAEK